MSAAITITFLTYLVTGAIPPAIAHYLLRVAFLGGIWAASLAGVVAAVLGGLLRTLFLPEMPNLIVIAGVVDLVPPLTASIVVTALFAFVSSSNNS